MPRPRRVDMGGQIYHVVNRGVAKMRLFETEADFAAFEGCMNEVGAMYLGVSVLAYCLMGNHWHLVLRTTTDGELARYMQNLTTMHVRRWLRFRQADGSGPIYQGRYRSFLCESGGHVLTVVRYVERNPLRANLVTRAEEWRWSSLGQWLTNERRIPLGDWPVGRPDNWIDRVNAPENLAEVQAIRRSSQTGQPYGHPAWQSEIRLRLGLPTPRKPGRPMRATEDI